MESPLHRYEHDAAGTAVERAGPFGVAQDGGPGPGRFPAPIRLAERVARCIEAEVKEWLQKRIERSRGRTPRRSQLEREGGLCVYTLKELDECTFVFDHVLSCPKGDNSYRNVVVSSRGANNKKGAMDAAKFLFSPYHEAQRA